MNDDDDDDDDDDGNDDIHRDRVLMFNWILPLKAGYNQ